MISYFIDVYKIGKPEFPLLQLQPKDLSEFDRWEKDIRALYKDYIVRSGSISKEDQLFQ